MRQYTIDDAKRLITDFCEEEYGLIADFLKRSKHYENKLHHRN